MRLQILAWKRIFSWFHCWMKREFIIWMDKEFAASRLILTPCDLEGYQLPVPVGMGTQSVHLQTMYEELFSLYGGKGQMPKPRYCRSR